MYHETPSNNLHGVASSEAAGAPTPVSPEIEQSYQCGICGVEFEGRELLLEAYLTDSSLKVSDRLGHRCGACGATSCGACKAKGVRFGWWSGYSKSSCGSCGATFNQGQPTSFVIVPARTTSKTPVRLTAEYAREFVLKDVLADNGHLGDAFICQAGIAFVSYGPAFDGVALQDALHTMGFGLFGKALGAGDVAKKQALADRMHEQNVRRQSDYGLSVEERVKKRTESFVIAANQLVEVQASVESLALIDQQCLAVQLQTQAGPRRLVQIQSSQTLADLSKAVPTVLMRVSSGMLMPGLECDVEWGLQLGRMTGARFISHLVGGDIAAVTGIAAALPSPGAFKREVRSAIDTLTADDLNALIATARRCDAATSSLVRNQLAAAMRGHVSPWISVIMILLGIGGIAAALHFEPTIGGWYWAILLVSALVLFGTRETIPDGVHHVRLRRMLRRFDAATGA